MRSWTKHEISLITDSCYVLQHLNQHGAEGDHTKEIFTINMLDECLRKENYIDHEYDWIHIMMGMNGIRHTQNGINGAKTITKQNKTKN